MGHGPRASGPVSSHFPFYSGSFLRSRTQENTSSRFRTYVGVVRALFRRWGCLDEKGEDDPQWCSETLSWKIRQTLLRRETRSLDLSECHDHHNLYLVCVTCMLFLSCHRYQLARWIWIDHAPVPFQGGLVDLSALVVISGRVGLVGGKRFGL